MSELLNGIEDDEEDVEEEDVTAEPCPCLFCSAEQPSALATLDHCKTEHGVDLLLIATKLGRNLHSLDALYTSLFDDLLQVLISTLASS